MLIAGDFNYPGIDWEIMFQHAPDHPANQFLDALNDCMLHCLYFIPGRQYLWCRFSRGRLARRAGPCLINHPQLDRFTVIGCRPLGACPYHGRTLEEIGAPPSRRASIPEPPCLSELGPIALPFSFSHFLNFLPDQYIII